MKELFAIHDTEADAFWIGFKNRVTWPTPAQAKAAWTKRHIVRFEDQVRLRGQARYRLVRLHVSTAVFWDGK